MTVAYDTTPPLAAIVSAVGGGPLLLAHGVPVDDPFSPAPEETNVRFPVAGAGLEPNGTLLLVVVDGRRPDRSIGVTRPQFGALLRGLGATDALAFDSGGSATLVARVLGDAGPSVLNEPSDGRERPVADGLFVYSDAALGLHPRLVVHPSTVVAFRGATVRFRAAIVDDAGHRLGDATVPPLAVGAGLGERVATVQADDGLRAAVPLRVVDRVARLDILPDAPNPAPNTQLTLTAQARDARGLAVITDGVDLRWTTPAGPLVAPQLRYDAARGDASIAVALGGASAVTRVRVGAHAVAIPYAETQLAYDFTGSARAAYANTSIVLPDEPTALGLVVFGDGNGVPLRASFLNRFGERSVVTLAAHVDWQGWQRVTIRLPGDLNPPIRLTSLYVVPSLGGPPVRASGALRFRDLSVVVPGLS